MGRKSLQRRIKSLLERIQEHEHKILVEQQKASPDQGLIRHWEKEIGAFKQNLARAKKRLGR